MLERYGSCERIRKKKEFSELYKRGRCARGKYFNLIYLPNNLGYSRMAVVASKKVGNAVHRNKIRRRVRELFRRNKDLLKYSLDILLIARREIRFTTWPVLRDEYIAAVQAVGGNE